MELGNSIFSLRNLVRITEFMKVLLIKFINYLWWMRRLAKRLILSFAIL